jgi:hypothetical protein
LVRADEIGHLKMISDVPGKAGHGLQPAGPWRMIARCRTDVVRLTGLA